MAENTNTERDLEQLGCYLECRGGVWVVQYAEGGCMPASVTEKRLWDALQESRASLSLPAAGQEPVAHQYLGADGKWHDFIDARHCKNTIESGLWQIRPLYAAPQPAVAAGWVMVPIEPTHDMKLAGFDAISKTPKSSTRRQHMDAVWSAMLAALPPAPSTEGA